MLTPIEDEFKNAKLGDARLTKRAMLVAKRWSAAPSASFPNMMEESDAELQGTYGLLGNESVEYEDLIASHAGATLARIDECYSGKVVLVLHDTTDFGFDFCGTEREGLGWLSLHRQGFHAHFAFAVSADGSRRPLGVVGLSIHMRERPVAGKAPRTRDGKTLAKDPTRESLRWGALADETSTLLRGHCIPIHVSDCESDIYEYLSGRRKNDQRFVVRVRELDRPVTSAADDFENGGKLRHVAERAVIVAERDVHLHRRRKSQLPAANKKHPPRDARKAKLAFAAETVRIRRPKHLDKSMLEEIELNLVHVREIDPPEHLEPVEWLLLTTEPIETAADILTVVDYYRARWTIEEYNQAIKTGCQYEQRQLESAHALLIALALCIPVAWQMLALRHQSREEPDAPATTVLSPRRLEVLRTIAKKKKLSKEPTAKEVFYAIAALGGHIARNGPPGWRTLRGGLERLLLVEAAFDMRDAETTARMRCDQ